MQVGVTLHSSRRVREMLARRAANRLVFTAAAVSTKRGSHEHRYVLDTDPYADDRYDTDR